MNRMYPGSARFAYWLPTFFVIGLLTAIAAIYWDLYGPILIYLAYLLAVAIDAGRRNRSLFIGLLSGLAAIAQFTGYGTGFFRSVYRLFVLRKPLKEVFPAMWS